MPTLDSNSATWDGAYDWQRRGEEWSEAWGGSEPQWYGTLYPRVHKLLPTNAILEIGPGFGRWTKFLLSECIEYLGVDISKRCIAACQKIFANAEHARFCQNNGLSLNEAADDHFDFVFSFDSLVHAEADVISSYVPQILRKLTPEGVAFLHHSNLAGVIQVIENKHFRGASVSAGLVADTVLRAGGKTIIQEIINWGSPYLTDCFTLFARQEFASEEPVHIENTRFMDEAAIVRDSQSPYSGLKGPVAPLGNIRTAK